MTRPIRGAAGARPTAPRTPRKLRRRRSGPNRPVPGLRRRWSERTRAAAPRRQRSGPRQPLPPVLRRRRRRALRNRQPRRRRSGPRRRQPPALRRRRRRATRGGRPRRRVPQPSRRRSCTRPAAPSPPRSSGRSGSAIRAAAATWTGAAGAVAAPATCCRSITSSRMRSAAAPSPIISVSCAPRITAIATATPGAPPPDGMNDDLPGGADHRSTGRAL